LSRFLYKEKGSHLIELTLILPICIAGLHILSIVGDGWQIRNKNRLLSRYYATFVMRRKKQPNTSVLLQKFNISANKRKNIHFHDDSSSNWSFTPITLMSKPLVIQHHYFLWKNK